MIGCVFADDIDDRRACSTCVVQVGQPVGEPWSQMQQRTGRLAGHSCVAVGSTGHHTFEEPKYATHTVLGIERRDEVHLGGARVREADFQARIDKGL